MHNTTLRSDVRSNGCAQQDCLSVKQWLEKSLQDQNVKDNISVNTIDRCRVNGGAKD